MTRGQELASELFENLPGESLGKSHYDLIVQAIDFAVTGERERCAKIVEGQSYKEHYRMWPEVSTVGNRSMDDETTKHCMALATAVRGVGQSAQTKED